MNDLQLFSLLTRFCKKNPKKKWTTFAQVFNLMKKRVDFTLLSAILVYMNDTKAENSLKDFNDLEFKPHPNSSGVMARFAFGPVEVQGSKKGDHRYEISVVANKGGDGGHYGNVEDNVYEVAMFHHGAYIPLQVSDDVLGWQTPEQITELMNQAQLNDFAWVCKLRGERVALRKELGLDN